MSNKEIQNWAQGVEIWKQKGSKSQEYDYLKSKLAHDVGQLWKFLKEWKITKSEYDNYANKLKWILESNNAWKKALDAKYESESKKVISEARWKSKERMKSQNHVIWQGKIKLRNWSLGIWEYSKKFRYKYN